MSGCATSQSNFVPTPQMSIGMDLNMDSVKWVMANTDGNRTGIIFEMVPDGQRIDAWLEMVSNQIVFTQVSLDDYVATFSAMLKKVDPNVSMETKTLTDGSMIITYSSPKADEFSIRRFFKASDGIYMFAYHARVTSKDNTRVLLWEQIILKAYFIQASVL
jgi:hypothetical protein